MRGRTGPFRARPARPAEQPPRGAFRTGGARSNPGEVPESHARDAGAGAAIGVDRSSPNKETREMADLIFYTHPMSRGQTVRWMLEEVGHPYDTEILEYGSSMKAEPYLSINPMGKVPAIAHNRKVITEVAAICCYL